DDLRVVARGWRWTRRRLAPDSASHTFVSFQQPAYQTAWARGPLARGVRDLFLSAALGPVLNASFDISVAGRERLDDVRSPAVFVANHTSHLDALLALHALPTPWRRRMVVAAATDYFFSAWWRSALAALALNAVPLERNSGGGDRDTYIRLLQTGWSVLAFPEGSRSRDGSLQRLHHGPSRLALDTGRPVVPLGIRGTFAAMPAGVSWPRPGRPRAVRVRIGAAVWPREGERTRELTARVRQALEQLLLEDATTWWTSLRVAPGSEPRANPDAARWRRVWENSAPLAPKRRPPIWPRT
ncbi:MAG TPA: lysophospholipid acyltransferase family protein, partial [Chloroflexota bacterium]